MFDIIGFYTTEALHYVTLSQIQSVSVYTASTPVGSKVSSEMFGKLPPVDIQPNYEETSIRRLTLIQLKEKVILSFSL